MIEPSNLTYRRVVTSGVGHGLAATTQRYIWQAVKPDGAILTSGQRTRALCEQAATDLLADLSLMARPHNDG